MTEMKTKLKILQKKFPRELGKRPQKLSPVPLGLPEVECEPVQKIKQEGF